MSKNLYYLIYRNKGRVPELTLRVLDLSLLDFIKVRGERASKMFNAIHNVINAYSIEYRASKDVNSVILELPADVGQAVLLFMLLAYNAKNPEKYVGFLEKLMAGKIPFSKYLGIFVDVAVNLSELRSGEEKHEVIIRPSVARGISIAMQSFVKVLNKYEI
ncbi:MAG: hypothetical protein LZ173_07030 [Thaumarchaeota archaeon]|jgi:hypothetical protein|nr:hypothetical protein [Candidatus Geocrenenecus arthurdayi]